MEALKKEKESRPISRIW